MCFFLMQVMQVFVFKQTKNNKRFHETPTGGGFYKEFFPEFGEMIQTFDPQLLTFSKTGQQKTSTNQLELLTNLPKACLMKMGMEYPEEKATCLGALVRRKPR